MKQDTEQDLDDFWPDNRDALKPSHYSEEDKDNGQVNEPLEGVTLTYACARALSLSQAKYTRTSANARAQTHERTHAQTHAHTKAKYARMRTEREREVGTKASTMNVDSRSMQYVHTNGKVVAC